MLNPADIEAAYQEYTRDLLQWLPDGVIEVDLTLLQSLGLLRAHPDAQEKGEGPTEHEFHIFENQDKITLINEKYVVWVVPELVEGAPKTFTLVALNQDPKLPLELAFAAAGVYNSSKLVLRILEAFLDEIEENQSSLEQISGDPLL